jgi:hypothetical protein
VDWSNGGDGIVVRDSIKTMSDCAGRPSSSRRTRRRISSSERADQRRRAAGGSAVKFTQDAFQAAAAFNGDKSLAGVVSWAPDIYNLEKVRGNRMMVTTATANKLIADVWFSRGGFRQGQPRHHGGSGPRHPRLDAGSEAQRTSRRSQS